MAEITLFKAGRLTHWDSEYDLEESEQRALWLETRTVTLGSVAVTNLPLAACADGTVCS